MATQIKTQAAAALNLVRLSKQSQEGLVSYLEQCKLLGYNNWDIRNTMREIDIQYAREQDYTSENTKAKIANRYGNTNKFQNIVVPVVLPQVEAAVTYQASVFLTGVPLFGVESDPRLISPAKQLETIIDNQAIRGGWTSQILMNFRDAFKYNFSILEVDWCRETIPDFSTDVSSNRPNSLVSSKVSWEGNVVNRWDPYNTFWDIRYNVTDISKRGEFVGTDDLISRVELKKYLAQTPYIIRNNIKDALEAPAPGISLSQSASQLTYYIPQISRTQTINPALLGQFNWMAWGGLEKAGKSINYTNIYQKTTLYARIIPSDFGIEVPGSNTPQIWKLVYINSSALVYAQPVSLAYDVLPVFFGQPNQDGLRYQTKSPAQNSVDFQSVASAMMNSVIHSRRRAISDRVLYDPSRISEAQINSDNPSAKIPVRPAAYGKNISESVYAFPFRDDQAGQTMQEIKMVLDMANTQIGQNQAKQGQFVKGNRTRSEYESVMGNANGRDQLISIGFEAQQFTPLKEMLKINILQFQTPATLYSRELKAPITVDPVELRKSALQFKLSDGLIPDSKLINGEALAQAFTAMGTTPSIAAGYNIAPLFSYLMKTQGADLTPFEKSPAQTSYEQALSAWSQASAQVTAEIQVLIKAAIPEKIEDLITKLKAALPPQPKPQDYGYTPGTAVPTPDKDSILNQTQSVLNPPQQQSSPNGPL